MSSPSYIWKNDRCNVVLFTLFLFHALRSNFNTREFNDSPEGSWRGVMVGRVPLSGGRSYATWSPSSRFMRGMQEKYQETENYETNCTATYRLQICLRLARGNLIRMASRPGSLYPHPQKIDVFLM